MSDQTKKIEQEFLSFGDSVSPNAEKGESYKRFHPEVEKAIPLKEVLNQKLLIEDAVIITNWESQFGVTDFAILLARFEDDVINPSEKKSEEKRFTVMCGGKIVIGKIQRAIDEKSLPLWGIITVVQGEQHRYYDIR